MDVLYVLYLLEEGGFFVRVAIVASLLVEVGRTVEPGYLREEGPLEKSEVWTCQR